MKAPLAALLLATLAACARPETGLVLRSAAGVAVTEEGGALIAEDLVGALAPATPSSSVLALSSSEASGALAAAIEQAWRSRGFALGEQSQKIEGAVPAAFEIDRLDGGRIFARLLVGADLEAARIYARRGEAMTPASPLSVRGVAPDPAGRASEDGDG